MHCSDQITVQLLYLHDYKSLTLHWRSFSCIVHSTSAAINNSFQHNLNLIVAVLPNCDLALCLSQGQYHYCTVHTHTTKIHISCQTIDWVCYISVHHRIVTSYCLPFAHNISLTEFLSEAIYRILWNIDAFCSTVSLLPHSSSFQLHWVSPTPFQPVSWTAMLAKSIWEHWAWHSHFAALGVRDPQCYCLGRHQIDCLPHNQLLRHLDNPSCPSSSGNSRCPKCFQVRIAHHFWVDDGSFFGFGRHWTFEFILHGGSLQTMLVAKEIFLTIEMPPHNQVERVIRTLWRSLLCPKCILRLASACFEHEIPSV